MEVACVRCLADFVVLQNVVNVSKQSGSGRAVVLDVNDAAVQLWPLVFCAGLAGKMKCILFAHLKLTSYLYDFPKPLRQIGGNGLRFSFMFLDLKLDHMLDLIARGVSARCSNEFATRTFLMMRAHKVRFAPRAESLLR